MLDVLVAEIVLQRPSIRFDLLGMGGRVRREEAYAQCRDDGQMPLHGGASHFGFGAQSELIVLPA
jgi:hypothetical protein